MKRFLVPIKPLCNSPNSENNGDAESSTSAETAPKRPRSEVVNKNDVGNFVNIRLSESQRVDLLTNTWVPPKNYEFPLLQKFEARKLKFCYKWLDEFPWLAYSELQHCAFCVPYVAFSRSGGKGSQPLGHLVKTKFDNWKKAKETYQEHQKKSYHIHAVADSDNFLRIEKNKSQSVENLIDESRMQQIAKNRQNIVPVIEAIIVLGRQELALRGHRDSGNIVMQKLQNNFTGPNEGNFRALLKYRAMGDPFLHSHLEGPGKRDKYTSPSVQNEMIDACYEILTQKVISKIKAAKFYSVLMDETQDAATIEQVTNCIHYVSTKDDGQHIIREDFVCFIPTASTIGDVLAKLMVENLQRCELDISFMIGQGYDGASNMSGQYNGVQAIIRTKYVPHALYVHFAAHSLNLAISITSKIPAIRDCLSTIETVYNFFHTPKRRAILENAIEECAETPRTKTLKRLNLTRWVSKYEAVDDFYELFPFVYETLDKMRTSESDAKQLKNAMDFEFLISLHSINQVYQVSLPLSREFQKVDLDLVQAMDLAKDLRDELKRIRAEEDAFSGIYEASKKIAETFDIETKHKRIVGIQKNRENPDVQSTEDYFRVTVFNPFLDFYIMDLGERFINHENILEGFSALFKHDSLEIDESSADKFIKTVKFYQQVFAAGPPAVLVELKMWKRYLIRKGDIKPKHSLEALDNCPEANFPNINMLLRILATLPVSTSTAERTFSSLKRIKTIQRNTIKEDRLNGLAVLAIHRDIGITDDEVINELAKKPENWIFFFNRYDLRSFLR